MAADTLFFKCTEYYSQKREDCQERVSSAGTVFPGLSGEIFPDVVSCMEAAACPTRISGKPPGVESAR